MPIYAFKNTKTGEEHERIMSHSSREQYLQENPDIICIPGVAAIGDPVRMGLKKPDAGFQDVLKNIKSKHYKSTVNTWN